MGFFKDIKKLQQTAKEMTPPEHRGIGGGLRAMRDGVAQANDMLGGLQADAAKAQHLAVSGVPGSATVTGIRQTGMVVNENPQVELDLQVSIEGREPYSVTHQQVIAMIAIPQFQPGATVPVKVDPADPQSLIVA